MDPLCTAIQGLLSTRCHTLLYRGFAWFCWNAKTEEILNKELFHRDPLSFRIPVLHSAKVCFCCCIFCCRCSEVVELTWMNKVWSLEIPKKLLYLICFPSDNQAETCQTAPEVQLEKSRMSNTPHRSWVFRRLSRFCFFRYLHDRLNGIWIVCISYILSSYGCVSSRLEYLQYVWYIWELGMMENYWHFSHPKMCKV